MFVRHAPYVSPRYRRADHVETSPPESFRAFGQAVRDARKAIGITQTDLASVLRSLGHRVHAPDVSAVERGIKVPTAQAVNAWIAALQAPSTLRKLRAATGK